MTAASLTDDDGGWRARLNLRFFAVAGATRLRQSDRIGPLAIQRPFYPGDGVCHAYLLHPPGGLVGGDRLEIGVEVGAGASALLTTPAANKVYRSIGPSSSVTNSLRVEAGSTLEWLPRDTILFGGSRLQTRSEIALARDARFFGWEMVALGRPRSGDHYSSGCLDQRLMLRIDGAPVLLERNSWTADDAVLTARWGLGGKRVLGLAWAYPADDDTVERARRLIAEVHETMAATLVDGVLVLRALADDAVALGATMAHLWAELRPVLLGRPASAPRIWAT